MAAVSLKRKPEVAITQRGRIFQCYQYSSTPFPGKHFDLAKFLHFQYINLIILQKFLFLTQIKSLQHFNLQSKL